MSFESSADAGNPAVYSLVRRIRKAIGREDFAAAERHCLELIEIRPQHEAALGYLASRSVQAGDHARARALAERGLAAVPGSATLQFHLGCALAAAGEHVTAHMTFERAYSTDPQLLLALFRRGSEEQALGQDEIALGTFITALELARKRGVLNARATLPLDFNARIDAAIDLVQAARKTAVTAALEPVRARHGEAAVARARRAFDAHLGLIPTVWPHPLQRPTFLLFPDLPPQPWFEREQFPFLAEIERHTDMIRAELVEVLRADLGMQPYVMMADDAPAAPIWRELNRSPRWSGYHLFRHGERLEENCRRCPKTVALLEQLAVMRIPDHSPEALFSVLRPHTHIPPHTGVINGRLTVHLPLIVPENCGRLRAGEESRPWKEGECLIFDDSFVHEAWNDTDQTRVVLIFDVWNPYLGEPEREAATEAIAALGRFNRRYKAPASME